MRNIWILAEQEAGEIKAVSYELLTRGLTLAEKSGRKLCAMVFGEKFSKPVLNELILRGAERVVAVEAPELKHFLIEPYSVCMLELIKKYQPEIILAAATSTGRTLMPYVAMTADAGLTADCTELDIEAETGLLLQTRPAIGGNIMATIKCPEHRPQMSTIRPKSTPEAPRQEKRIGEIIYLKAPANVSKSRIKYENFQPYTEEINLQDAEKIVVVGRGIKTEANIKLAREFADLLGAALGATREVIDRGWLSYPHQIGLSGKTVSPELYVGIGVSGAIQHLAGMQTSKRIIAINKDPEAQIFHVADFGIVGDIFEVLPVLIEKLKRGEKI